MTVDYLKTRKQFGVTIGSFQALQHRAADMTVALEQARSMMYLAAMMADEDDAEERAKTMSAVKAQIGRSAKFIGQQAVQMHGGIAMTYEYKAGHLFKRLTMIDTAYGDADVHVRRSGRPQQPVRLTLVERGAHNPCHRVRAVRRRDGQRFVGSGAKARGLAPRRHHGGRALAALRLRRLGEETRRGDRDASAGCASDDRPGCAPRRRLRRAVRAQS